MQCLCPRPSRDTSQHGQDRGTGPLEQARASRPRSQERSRRDGARSSTSRTQVLCDGRQSNTAPGWRGANGGLTPLLCSFTWGKNSAAGPKPRPAVGFTQTDCPGLALGKAPEPTWKVRSQSCSSGGGATEGMRRRRAWPALALRRSPKVVVGLGMQGPSVLDHSRGESKAKVSHECCPGPRCAHSPQSRGAHKPPARSLPPAHPLPIASTRTAAAHAALVASLLHRTAEPQAG